MNINLCHRLLIAAAFVAVAAAATACSKDRNAGVEAGIIMPADVSFPGMQMRPGSDRSTYTLIGRIKNKSSRSTITEVTLNVWMEDVLESGASTTLAPVSVVLQQEVPPGGSRGFEKPVVFRDLPKPKGRHEWNYAVARLKGK